MTEKDIADAILLLTKVDWIAFHLLKLLRFKRLQDLIAEHAEYKIPIIAKIEMPEALEHG
jgi:pyruvate kinase